MSAIQYIDDAGISGKKILVRVDFNVPITKQGTVAHDVRIKQAIPTLELLLKNNNKLILVSYVNRPAKRDKEHSLGPVVKKLGELLPGFNVVLVDDFREAQGKKLLEKQTEKDIMVLENIRFYPQEKENDMAFAQELADLADVYVNEAFSVCHREEASVTSVPTLIPSYGGLRLKNEVTEISSILNEPKKPVVVILGGSKISTKINLITRLMDIADYFLIGGGMANTFLGAQGVEIGKSLNEAEAAPHVQEILERAHEKKTKIILPADVVIGNADDRESPEFVKTFEELKPTDTVLDIGPATEALFGTYIAQANTIIWNGPMGYFENPAFSRGTEFVYYAITQNTHATSLVGGGDTVAAVSQEAYLDKITHISTGGGAMLEFIEKGTLPGIEVLKK